MAADPIAVLESKGAPSGVCVVCLERENTQFVLCGHQCLTSVLKNSYQACALFAAQHVKWQ